MFNSTFEKEYSEYTDTPLQTVIESRLGNNSYAIPKISNAWVFYQNGYSHGVDDELERQFCGEK